MSEELKEGLEETSQEISLEEKVQSVIDGEQPADEVPEEYPEDSEEAEGDDQPSDVTPEADGPPEIPFDRIMAARDAGIPAEAIRLAKTPEQLEQLITSEQRKQEAENTPPPEEIKPYEIGLDETEWSDVHSEVKNLVDHFEKKLGRAEEIIKTLVSSHTEVQNYLSQQEQEQSDFLVSEFNQLLDGLDDPIVGKTDSLDEVTHSFRSGVWQKAYAMGGGAQNFISNVQKVLDGYKLQNKPNPAKRPQPPSARKTSQPAPLKGEKKDVFARIDEILARGSD